MTEIRPTTDAGRLRSFRRLILVLNFLATFQVVCYLLLHVPFELDMMRYENGLEKMPFQGRVMMMLVLRWAHHNSVLIGTAASIAGVASSFFPHMGPEFLMLLIIDMTSIGIAGCVATRIYQAASRERLLTPLLTLLIYPLVLVFFVMMYLIQTTQHVNFYYDLPSLAFFSIGMYLIYFRRSPALLAAIFLVGTINRETTLFLLMLYVLAGALDGDRLDWQRLRTPRIWAVVLPLGICWVAWHHWINWVFRSNPIASSWRCTLNLESLIWPLGWSQLLSAGCYMLPVIYLCRRSIKDPTLRLWLWTIPAWIAMMFFYGLWIEARIYGELIPYLVCLSALIAEQAIGARFKDRNGSSEQVLQLAPE